MKHKKLIIAGLAILLIIDFSLAYQSYQSGKSPAYEVVLARMGDIAEQVSSTGTVEPASKINLQFTASGRVAAVNVKVGDKVTAGQVLLVQDSSDLAFQAQNAEAALKLAQAKYAQLLAGASQEDIALIQTSVLNAKKTLEDAKKSLSDVQASADNALAGVYEDSQRTLQTSLLTDEVSLQTNGDTLDRGDLNVLNYQSLLDAKSLRISAGLEYEAAEPVVGKALASNTQSDIDQALLKLKSSLTLTLTALNRTYDALASGIVSSDFTQTELDTLKLNISTARSNVSAAITNIVSAQQTVASQKITNQTNVNAAQAKVTTAEGALVTSENQLALKIAKPRQSDIDLYEAQVRQAQATLSQVRNQIAQKSLVAPIDGIITDVALEKGEMATASQTIVSMNSLSNFEIQADIPETDIAKVKIGQLVSVTLDAFGDKQIWQGQVTKIDPAQTVVQGVVYYATTVGLSGDDTQIKAGMTANLDIETARHTGVLIIPARAINQNGKKFVKALDGSVIKETEIETGIKSADGEVEILSGLKEGDKIVIDKK
ncbi:MAG: efflux RND transporter periplasmic adaptor subunit [bacterium]